MLRLGRLLGGVTIAAVALLPAGFAYAAAAAVVTDASGMVQVQVGTQPPRTVGVGQLVDAGATVTTGSGASAVLRFEDGQVAALAERTNFRIVGYQFNAREPDKGSAFVNLIEGGLRFVTGLIGRRNPGGIRIQAATVTAGIRGTDLSLAVQGGAAVVTVNEGRISLSLPTGQTLSIPAGQGANVARDGSARQAPAAQIRQQLAQTPQGQRLAAQLTTLQALAPKIQEAVKAPPPSQQKPAAKPEAVKPGAKPEAAKPEAAPTPTPIPTPTTTTTDTTTVTAPTTTTTTTTGTSGAGGGGSGTTASPN